MDRFFEESAIKTTYKLREEHEDYLRRREHNQEQKRFQEMKRDCERDIPKMQKCIKEIMDNSMLNSYVDNLKINQVDPQAYKFLVLRKDEFLKLRILKCARKSFPIREIKKQALPSLGMISGLMLAFSFPFTGVIATSLVLGSGMLISTGSGLTMMSTAHRLQEQETDDRAILQADVEELKGGMRFFKACEKVYRLRDRVKDNNSSLFDRLFLSTNSGFWGRFSSTSSEEGWIPSLAMNPSWKERITKIEKKLQDRGEDISTTQEEEQKIALLEELV